MNNDNEFESTGFLKKNIRKILQDKRDNLLIPFRKEVSNIIAEKFFDTDYYTDSNNILIYYPFGSEVDTTIVINKALKDGKNIILPRVSGQRLKLFYVDDTKKQLKRGAYGIMEPNSVLCEKAKISDMDLAVVPGVVFDRNLNRLGYGRGFYDRLLAHIPKRVKKISLCFDIQVIDMIPVSKNDIKVDLLITDTGIYYPQNILMK
ncbi:MAG: 5-formyltetrahydrofolate cyclo-ligase [Actinomycetota bacterium]|nr:5-formyltetrahydrofolate cyclo-ligase [Actinomycetota bacterium]